MYPFPFMPILSLQSYLDGDGDGDTHGESASMPWHSIVVSGDPVWNFGYPTRAIAQCVVVAHRVAVVVFGSGRHRVSN